MTRAELARVARDEDTKVITELRRELAVVTADRDDLLHGHAAIANALGLPEGTELTKVIVRIQELL